MVELHYEILAEDINSSEWVIKAATGRKPVAKVEAFYGNNARLISAMLEQLQGLWPHMDGLGKSLHEGGGKYLSWGAGHDTDNEWIAGCKHGKPPWKRDIRACLYRESLW